jgi:hypothetical protein
VLPYRCRVGVNADFCRFLEEGEGNKLRKVHTWLCWLWPYGAGTQAVCSV